MLMTFFMLYFFTKRSKKKGSASHNRNKGSPEKELSGCEGYPDTDSPAASSSTSPLPASMGPLAPTSLQERRRDYYTFTSVKATYISAWPGIRCEVPVCRRTSIYESECGGSSRKDGEENLSDDEDDVIDFSSLGEDTDE